MNLSGIYRIRNRLNGHFYVGQSQDITRRLIRHKTLLCADKHPNSYLQRAFNKHGGAAFQFEPMMVSVPLELLDLLEQSVLDDCHPDYNIAVCAEASARGLTRTPKTRARISAVQVGKTLTSEHRAHLSAAQTGRVHSLESRAKASVSQKGRIRGSPSPEHRAKISNANRGQVRSPEQRAKMSAWQKGKARGPLSPEHRAKISASGKAHWKANPGRKNG